MKKISILSLIIGLLLLSAFKLQDAKSAFPLDDEGNAYYSEVITLDGKSETILFDNAVKWLYKEFKNAANVITLQDKTNKIIEGKARFRLNNKDKDGKEVAGNSFINYSFKLEFREGRYKYEFYRIHKKAASYYDVTKLEDKEQTGYDAINFPFYIEQITKYFDDITAKLKEGISADNTEKEGDW